jgi:hypothetical protein
MLQTGSNRKEREREMERMNHNFNTGVREWVDTAVMLSTRIREVLCTNICRTLDILTGVLYGFPQSLQAHTGIA